MKPGPAIAADSKRRRRLLIAYSYASTHVTAIQDYLNAFKLFSGWDVDYVHVIERARIDFDFSCYDALFQNYCARLCFEGYVSPSYIEAAKRFRGVKVISVQDDYDYTDTLRRAVADIGFDFMLTGVPVESWEYVYPKAMLPKTELVKVLTGYTPTNISALDHYRKPLAERPILIGYRGRDLGARYGRLGFEKREVGKRMKEICLARGLNVDIAWDEASRFYGESWFQFLGSCRAVLGSGSGSNVFDFDGAVVADYDRTKSTLGREPTYEEFEPRIRNLEAMVDMSEVSPRVFESIQMRTPLIQLEGRYSGILEPDRHFISLKKDFSNIDDVLRRLDDLEELQAMADRVYDDLIASGRYSYKAFVDDIMDRIESRLDPNLAVEGGIRAREINTDLLNTLIASPDPLLEWPTVRPMHQGWYDIAVAQRHQHYIHENYKRLLSWARREVNQAKPEKQLEKNAALDAIEQRVEAACNAFVTGLQRALAQSDRAAVEAATALLRRDYDALLNNMAETVLSGISWVDRCLATVRAPWVETDIPALRKAKRLRERASRVPGLRAAKVMIQAARESRKSG